MKSSIHIILLFLTAALNGQTKIYTVNDGLPGDDIAALLQDRRGMLWIGTSNGLCVFDGYKFREPIAGFPGTRIKCMYEDPRGLIWIGSWEGLYIIDPAAGTFTTRLSRIPEKDGRKVNIKVNCIAGFENGTVMAGCGDGNLYRFDDAANYKKVFDAGGGPDGVRRQITAITAGDSACWIVSDYRRTEKLGRNFTRVNSFGNKVVNVNAVLKLPGKNDLFLLDRWGEVFNCSGEDGKILKNNILDSVNTRHKNISTGYLSLQDGLWIGYEDGSLVQVDNNSGTVTDHSAAIKPGIDGAVRVILPDRYGMIWLGTNYGLVAFRPERPKFGSFLRQPAGVERGLKHSIRGMDEDNRGDIYIGGYTGLHVLEHKTGAIRDFTFGVEGKRADHAFYPYALICDSEYVWMGSEVKGFYRLNKTTGRLEFPVNLKPAAGSNKTFYSTFALLADGDSIWTGTGNGLFIYRKKKEEMIRYALPGDKYDLSGLEVSAMIKQGPDLWIGTRSSGLFRLVKDRGIVSVYSDTCGLNYINCLYAGRDNNIWAGTRGYGICRIDPATGEIVSYSKSDGLADNSVAGITPGDNGILWISTFNGLSRFDPATKKFRNYYLRDGLNDNEFNISAHLRTRSGRICLGGLNGLNTFSESDLTSTDQVQPRIFAGSYSRNNGPARLPATTGSAGEFSPISFSPSDRSLSFTFALDDYYDARLNSFSYMLDGFDHDWNYLGNQNTLQFNSLPAGNYILKIKGTGSSGIGSANELSIPLKVQSVFYKTGWFYALLALCSMTAVFFGTRYRMHQQMKLKLLRTRISSDLHDEVGGLLTRISVMAQGAEKSDTTNLQKIAETSRKATEAMNDVLWSIDARNDTTGDLLDRLREHAAEALHPLDIEVRFTADSLKRGREMPGGTRRNIFLIFKEAVNNIAKHSGATEVEVICSEEPEQFILKIKDNGKGTGVIAPARPGQGIKNMEMRARDIGGRITISTTAGCEINLVVNIHTRRR